LHLGKHYPNIKQIPPSHCISVSIPKGNQEEQESGIFSDSPKGFQNYNYQESVKILKAIDMLSRDR
jgi:hypothetical protein